MSGAREGEGKQAFFWLAALVLGGLIFAAGVLVGRGLGQPTAADPRDPLTRIDERTDQLPPPAPDGGLVFPKVLEGPPVEPPRRPEPPAEPRDAGITEARDAGPAEPRDAGSGPAVPEGGEGAQAAAEARPGAPCLCLQVASFREAGQAEALAARLRATGYPEVRVGSAEAGAKGVFYRVRLGRFSAREAAEQARARLDQEERLKALVLSCEP